MYNALRVLHPAFSTCQIIFSPLHTHAPVGPHAHACENVFEHKIEQWI